jgi:hypothetical protein
VGRTGKRTKQITRTTRPEVFAKILEAWLDEHNGVYRGDARVFPRGTWPHPVGRGADLVLSIDGSPLHAVVNYGEPSRERQENLVALARHHGYRVELGYTWSLNFYTD